MSDRLDRPRRIQRKRTKGWRMPEGAIYVGRPTVFGNPFHPPSDDRNKPRPSDRLRRVENFRLWLTDRRRSPWFGREADEARSQLLTALPNLRGRDLACWCPVYKPCSYDGVGGHDFLWGPNGATRAWCRLCRTDDQELRVACHADVLLELANA